MISIEDRKFELSIDNLDDACLQLPALYAHWYHKEAKAKSERDDLKDSLAILMADAELSYRSYSLQRINTDFDLSLKAITEAAIKALVLTDADIRERTIRLHKANRDYNVCLAKRRSLEKTADLADLLGRLWMKGFFYDATIKEVGDLAEKGVKSKVAQVIRSSKNWPQSEIDKRRQKDD